MLPRQICTNIVSKITHRRDNSKTGIDVTAFNHRTISIIRDRKRACINATALKREITFAQYYTNLPWRQQGTHQRHCFEPRNFNCLILYQSNLTTARYASTPLLSTAKFRLLDIIPIRPDNSKAGISATTLNRKIPFAQYYTNLPWRQQGTHQRHYIGLQNFVYWLFINPPWPRIVMTLVADQAQSR